MLILFTLLTLGLPTLALADAHLSTVPRYTAPTLDRAAAIAAHPRNRQQQPTPLVFAEPHAVSISPSTHGHWETLPNGGHQWRLRIEAPGALAINLGFTRYHLPAGASLRLVNAETGQQQGPYGGELNPRGQFWSPLIPGDTLLIIVQIPAADVAQLDLQLSTINRSFRPLASPQKSGACNVDVVCPEGDNWRSQISSVGAYTLFGFTVCTGALINNTAQDGKPYFLTAHHCGVSEEAAGSIVVYWNYQNSRCRTPGSSASGQPGNGSFQQNTSGATLRASYSPSDMTLLELDSPPDPTFDVDWAGWDARAITRYASTIAVHHPGVEEKRISFENHPTSTTFYLSDTVNASGTHIRVNDWDLGTTEGGSSGSPLFDAAGRIIGQLHGGYAACGNDDPDWYGRIAVSWDGGGSSNTRLRDWLDPVGGGSILQLDPRSTGGDDTIMQDGFEAPL